MSDNYHFLDSYRALHLIYDKYRWYILNTVWEFFLVNLVCNCSITHIIEIYTFSIFPETYFYINKNTCEKELNFHSRSRELYLLLKKLTSKKFLELLSLSDSLESSNKLYSLFRKSSASYYLLSTSLLQQLSNKILVTLQTNPCNFQITQF